MATLIEGEVFALIFLKLCELFHMRDYITIKDLEQAFKKIIKVLKAKTEKRSNIHLQWKYGGKNVHIKSTFTNWEMVPMFKTPAGAFEVCIFVFVIHSAVQHAFYHDIKVFTLS